MSEYFSHYAESNIACAVIFAIMLVHDLMSVDRQEKQIKFDHTLFAFIAYFISDTFWAAVVTNTIPKTVFSAALVNFSNFIIMAFITYWWLNFVMAVLQSPHRNRPINKFAVLFPMIVSLIAVIIIFIVDHGLLLDKNLDPTTFYAVLQVSVPDIYIIAVFIYTIRKARSVESATEKGMYLALGLFPLALIIAGSIQTFVLPQSSIFCLGSTIVMVLFYIESMEAQISQDPLTKLNNRGQLRRYLSQDSTAHREGLDTYIMMLDINDFKKINDTHGHSEGDRALVIMADALRKAVGSMDLHAFIARYGGDEFTIVVHTADGGDIDELARRIRNALSEGCKAAQTPYTISTGIGWDSLGRGDDTVQKCIARADKKLYEDKEAVKSVSSRTA